jgi:alpha,alpha-trehalase
VIPDLFDAVVLDMDGVVTDTASLHLEAWGRVVDQALSERGPRDGEDHQPFSEADYQHYVDGRARYDGAAAVLAARGVTLPWGDPTDDSSVVTVCGMANRKDAYFLDLVRRRGVRVFVDAIAFIRACRVAGLKTAVVSASRNCAGILEAGGVTSMFDVRVDGVLAESLRLPGKPDPATFLEAARRLAVVPARAVVVEDAEAGVAAGRGGGFGLVLGVDRTGHAADLVAHGADLVVQDLRDVAVRRPRVGT